MEEMEYINKQLVEADIKAIKRYDVDINKTYAFIARRLYELKESEYFRNANYKGYKDIYDLALNEFGYQREKVRYLIEIYLKFFYEKFDNYYKNFSISQLKYMARMSEDKLEKCNPDMTIREIKSILIENTTCVGHESIENSTSENAVSQEKVINGIFPDEKEEDKTITPKIAGLSESTVAYILEQLEIFEKEQQFLDSKITQKLLSEKLGTNPTYLSKIINAYKGKNFSNYLNDLRLEYIVELLKTEHQFLEKEIKELANTAGFTNAEAFSDNFQRKFEIKPSYFIKMMKENIKTSSL